MQLYVLRTLWLPKLAAAGCWREVASDYIVQQDSSPRGLVSARSRVMVSLNKKNRTGKTGGNSQRGNPESQENETACSVATQQSCYQSPWLLFTYRQLAPGATDGHNLFTMEGEFLLKALE